MKREDAKREHVKRETRVGAAWPGASPARTGSRFHHLLASPDAPRHRHLPVTSNLPQRHDEDPRGFAPPSGHAAIPMPDPVPTAPLLAFATTYMMLAALPGPNFLVVAQASLSPRPRAGILAAAGIATGAGLLALLTLSLASRLGPDPAMALAAQAGFAGLLLLVGGRALMRLARPASSAASPRAPTAARRGVFVLAFATAAANPVSAAFFGSYLVASRSGSDAGLSAPAAAGTVFLVAALWFGALAWALSAGPFRSFLGRYRDVLDAAIALGLLMAGTAMLVRLLTAT